MFKKSILLSAGIAATLMGGQALANTGYLGAGIGTGWQDDTGVSTDASGWQVEGAVATSAPFGLNAQFDGFLSDVEGDNGNAYGGNAHLNFRSDSFLAGAFVGFQDQGSTPKDLTMVDVGAEAQAYLGMVTLSGSVGYIDDKDDNDLTGYFGNIGAKFFIGDHFALGGHVADFETKVGSTDGSILNGGLNAEYQLSGPLSFYAQYERIQDDDNDYSSDNLGVGVRYNFGTTLKERSQKGASLAEVNPMGNLRF